MRPFFFTLALLCVLACSRRESITTEVPADSGVMEVTPDSGIEMPPPVTKMEPPEPVPTTTCLKHVHEHMKTNYAVASDQDYLAAIGAACSKDEPALGAAARLASTKADWQERARILHRAAHADARFDKRCSLSDKDATRNMKKLVAEGVLPRNWWTGSVQTGCRYELPPMAWCGFNGGMFEYFHVLFQVGDAVHITETEEYWVFSQLGMHAAMVTLGNTRCDL